MRIESIHTRELPVPVEEVGRILDTLAGPDDKIWPIERWPNDPIGFDGPLGVGAGGGHGPIRYTVAAYEPGRRIAFEFEPRSGLRGHHRFEVAPVGSDGARMRHVLDVEADGIYRLVRPAFLGMHDALVEDLLDKAEVAATGRLARAARWPRWLRLANRIEGAPRPRRGRVAAIPGPGALVAPGGRARLAAWGVAAVFTARGLVFIPIDLAGGVERPYDPLDLAIYSPMSLAIGIGTAWLLRNSTAVGTAPARRTPQPDASHAA